MLLACLITLNDVQAIEKALQGTDWLYQPGFYPTDMYGAIICNYENCGKIGILQVKVIILISIKKSNTCLIFLIKYTVLKSGELSFLSWNKYYL